MILFMLNSAFLLRLSPYLAVGIVLLLAILVIYRQFVPGKRQAGSGCCGPVDSANEAGARKETVKNAKIPIQQDIPLCGSCKGCRVKDCPGVSPIRRTSPNPGKDRI